ncbi:unnamed protein product, partial [Phaeothamnion confervicola]
MALNGANFTASARPFVIHDARLKSGVEPRAAPAAGGTTLCLRGQSLYASEHLKARLVWDTISGDAVIGGSGGSASGRPSSGEVGSVALLDVSFDAATGDVTCVVPPLADTFASALASNGSSGSGASGGSRRTGSGNSKTGAVLARVELTVDGAEYLPTPEPLALYATPAELRLPFAFAPLEGGGAELQIEAREPIFR